MCGARRSANSATITWYVGAPKWADDDGGELQKHSSDEDALDGSDDADGLESSDDRNEPVLHVRAPLRELSGHAGVVIAADWLSGGKMAVTASWDRNGRLFDTETGDCINMLTGIVLTSPSCRLTPRNQVTTRN